MIIDPIDLFSCRTLSTGVVGRQKWGLIRAKEASLVINIKVLSILTIGAMPLNVVIVLSSSAFDEVTAAKGKSFFLRAILFCLAPVQSRGARNASAIADYKQRCSFGALFANSAMSTDDIRGFRVTLRGVELACVIKSFSVIFLGCHVTHYPVAAIEIAHIFIVAYVHSVIFNLSWGGLIQVGVFTHFGVWVEGSIGGAFDAALCLE